MAETASSREEEITFDAKRKPRDPCCEPEGERSNKLLKLDVLEADSCNGVKNGGRKPSDEQFADVAEGKDGGVIEPDVDEGDEDEDEEEEEDDSDDGEKSSEKAAQDRKGKGIMKDDKGKGKLIEEDDDDDDEDSSDEGSELGSEESELSDDPLAEVDLDNILPSRTRRRTVHPGVYFATDLGNDDDDSSDSDA